MVFRIFKSSMLICMLGLSGAALFAPAAVRAEGKAMRDMGRMFDRNARFWRCWVILMGACGIKSYRDVRRSMYGFQLYPNIKELVVKKA